MATRALSTRLRRARGRLLRAAAVAVVLGAILPSPAAQAHDVIESTNPANGSTVATLPDSVVLTFDHTPIDVGTEVQVKDSTGTNQSDGPAKIVDTDVTQALRPGAPAGTYTVVWRVVSADSHPIEGTFTFTAKAAGSSSAASAAVSQSAGAQAAGPQAATPASSQSQGTDPVLWIIIAAAVLAAVAVAAFLVRRALRPAPEGTLEDSPEE